MLGASLETDHTFIRSTALRKGCVSTPVVQKSTILTILRDI